MRSGQSVPNVLLRQLRLLQGGLEQPRRLGAQHGVTARGRGSLADATSDAAAVRGEKGLWNSYPSSAGLLSANCHAR
jgi:hypothetical protein